MNIKPPSKIRHAGNHYRFAGWTNGCARYEGCTNASVHFVPRGDITASAVKGATVIEL